MSTDTQQYFYAQTVLQQTLFDSTSGLALADGTVKYFRNADQTTAKEVYEVTASASGVYTYVAAGTTLTLSSLGTFVDSNGSNFIPILFPWTGTVDEPGDFDPYYIVVYNADGVEQFSLTGIPYSQYYGDTILDNESQNLLTDPQFSVVLFPGSSATITLTGTTTTTNIAPGWYITGSGTGTITLTQESLTSTSTTAAYALQVAAGTGVTAVTLYQRIINSPRLLAQQNIAAYLELASPGNVALAFSVFYKYSSDTLATEIFSGTTAASTSFASYSGAVEITEDFSNASASGYLDIQYVLPINATIQITNCQINSVESINDDITYIQTSTPQQESQLFYYYQPQLVGMPIKSWAAGWNFPYNPSQILGTSGTAATLSGINLSYYILDQTILFRSVDASFSWANAQTGLTLTCAIASQCALIQYLPAADAIRLLQSRMSMLIAGSSSISITGQINIYWTTGSIPALPSSLVTGLTSGVPTVASGWTQVPSPFTQYFTLGTSTTTTNLNLWDATANLTISSALNIAFVISFPALAVGQTLTLEYATLCSGDIATIPQATTASEYLMPLQYYYESSYAPGVAPGTVTAVDGLIAPQGLIIASGTLYGINFAVNYFTTKRTTPTTSLYSTTTSAAAGTVFGEVWVLGASMGTPSAYGVLTLATYWTVASTGTKGITYLPASGATSTSVSYGSSVSTGIGSSLIRFQYTADARLGVV